MVAPSGSLGDPKDDVNKLKKKATVSRLPAALAAALIGRTPILRQPRLWWGCGFEGIWGSTDAVVEVTLAAPCRPGYKRRLRPEPLAGSPRPTWDSAATCGESERRFERAWQSLEAALAGGGIDAAWVALLAEAVGCLADRFGAPRRGRRLRPSVGLRWHPRTLTAMLKPPCCVAGRQRFVRAKAHFGCGRMTSRPPPTGTARFPWVARQVMAEVGHDLGALARSGWRVP